MSGSCKSARCRICSIPAASTFARNMKYMENFSTFAAPSISTRLKMRPQGSSRLPSSFMTRIWSTALFSAFPCLMQSQDSFLKLPVQWKKSIRQSLTMLSGQSGTMCARDLNRTMPNIRKQHHLQGSELSDRNTFR